MFLSNDKTRTKIIWKFTTIKRWVWNNKTIISVHKLNISNSRPLEVCNLLVLSTRNAPPQRVYRASEWILNRTLFQKFKKNRWKIPVRYVTWVTWAIEWAKSHPGIFHCYCCETLFTCDVTSWSQQTHRKSSYYLRALPWAHVQLSPVKRRGIGFNLSVRPSVRLPVLPRVEAVSPKLLNEKCLDCTHGWSINRRCATLCFRSNRWNLVKMTDFSKFIKSWTLSKCSTSCLRLYLQKYTLECYYQSAKG